VLGMTATQRGAVGPHGFLIPFLVLMALQALVLAAACRLPVRIHPASDSGGMPQPAAGR